MFANAGAAETWSDENDPEGRGLDRDASEMAISDRPLLNGFVRL